MASRDREFRRTLSEPSSLFAGPAPRSMAEAESMRSFLPPFPSSSTLRVSSCLFSSSPSAVLPLNWTSSVSPLLSGVGFSSVPTGSFSSPSWVRASARSSAVSGWWWASACDPLGQRYHEVGRVMAIAEKSLRMSQIGAAHTPRGQSVPWQIARRLGVCSSVAAGISSSRNDAVGGARSGAEQSGGREAAENCGTRENHVVNALCVEWRAIGWCVESGSRAELNYCELQREARKHRRRPLSDVRLKLGARAPRAVTRCDCSTS